MYRQGLHNHASDKRICAICTGGEDVYVCKKVCEWLSLLNRKYFKIFVNILAVKGNQWFYQKCEQTKDEDECRIVSRQCGIKFTNIGALKTFFDEITYVGCNQAKKIWSRHEVTEAQTHFIHKSIIFHN